MRHHDPSAAVVASRADAALTIDVVVESALWKQQRGLKTLLQRAISEAAARTSIGGGELAVLLVDDAAIRALNRDWRGQDKPTNVLSFPTRNAPPAAAAQVGRKPERLLGDIIIAYETTAREAAAAGMPLRNHVTHLAVHGFLHLIGHDHVEEEQADAMEALEIAILARLDVPDPYAPRDA
jgi:probable rRNA maturation factor